MPTQAEVTKFALEEFCREFVAQPYLCYTEHGLHARFFHKLHAAFAAAGLPVDAEFDGRGIGLLQKEYPTNRPFDRSRRQSWDVAVIENPIVPTGVVHPYDHLSLSSVVEFGLNYGAGHLLSDLERLAHRDAQVKVPMVAHLYRLSRAGARISKRDISPNSAAILTLDRVRELARPYPSVVVYYGMADVTNVNTSGIWRIEPDRAVVL